MSDGNEVETTYESNDRFIYRGEINSEGNFHGIGRIVWSYWDTGYLGDQYNGLYNQMYEGTFKNGMRTGFGRMIKWNGSWYEGEF